ncbi:MAG: acyl carrier protein [Bacilli bacterium]
MQKLIDVFNDVKPGIDINSNSLIDDGIIDSFDIITLISYVNSEFDIEFPVSEILPENFNSIKSLYEVINKIVNK